MVPLDMHQFMATCYQLGLCEFLKSRGKNYIIWKMQNQTLPSKLVKEKSIYITCGIVLRLFSAMSPSVVSRGSNPGRICPNSRPLETPN